MRSTTKAAVTVIPNAKVHVPDQTPTTALNAKTLKTESSACLNVHSQSTPKTETATIVMRHAAVARDLETLFPTTVVAAAITWFLTEPFRDV
jgi:hypothetical protein